MIQTWASNTSVPALPVSVKSFGPGGVPTGSVITAYNPQGLVLQQRVFNSAGSLVTTKSGSATAGGWRIVETKPSGDVVSIADVVTDRGRLVSVTRRDARETPLSSEEYEYDAAGRVSALLTKAGDGRLRTRTVYTYDKQGNNTKIEVFDASGALNNVFERQFDGTHLVVEKGYDASGALVAMTKTTWKGGRKLVQETVAPVSGTLEYSYETSDAPSALVRSVRGQVVERQTFEY